MPAEKEFLEGDLTPFIRGVYNSLRSEPLYSRYLFNLESLTDNAVPEATDIATVKGSQAQEIVDMSFLKGMVPDNVFVERYWAVNYNGVNLSNTLIHFIPLNSFHQQEQKNLLMAEAKCLRAIFYLNLVKYYGRIPLITNYIPVSKDLEDQLPASSEPEVVYQQIILDLEAAIQDLPPLIAGPSRVNLNVARAYLARAYFYSLALPSNTGNKTAIYTRIKEVTDAIINSGSYSLPLDYKDLFTELDEVNNEVLFSAQFINTGNSNDNHLREKFTEIVGNDYIEAHAFLPLDNLSKAFDDFGDATRKEVTITVANTLNKYKPDETANSQDFYIIRYAEILLMNAEADYEMDGNLSSQGEGNWNLVRNRVGLSPVNLAQITATGTTTEDPVGADPVRSAIRTEKRLELAFEGTRYLDLLSWGTLENALSKDATDSRVPENRSIEFIAGGDKYKRWPIPGSEIIPGKIIQNPGY